MEGDFDPFYDDAERARNRRLLTDPRLTSRFRRRFPLRAQSDTGLQSLIDRLRKEYKKYGGLKPRKPRGWKQKQLSKAASGDGHAGKSKEWVESDESEVEALRWVELVEEEKGAFALLRRKLNAD